MPSPTVTVRGVTVPSLGYGTWQVEGEAAYEGVLDALEIGYRHIATALMHRHNPPVGRGGGGPLGGACWPPSRSATATSTRPSCMATRLRWAAASPSRPSRART